MAIEIKTDYPVYSNGSLIAGDVYDGIEGVNEISSEGYANASGDSVPDSAKNKVLTDAQKNMAIPPNNMTVDQAKKAGWDWNKAKGWFKKGVQAGQQTGVFDYLKNMFGVNTTTPPYVNPSVYGSPTAPPPSQTKSSATPYLIIGGIAVVGAIIYFATQGKESGTK